MEEFTGRTAVVTGGGSGIGRGMALTWAAEGMNVVVADIESAAASAVAAEVIALGSQAIAVECDVTQLESVRHLADAAFGTFGNVNILCNNAGVVLNRPLIDCTLDDWHWVLGVNLFGVVHGVDSFLPRMRMQGSPGYIVNTASGAGLAGGRPTGGDISGGTDVGIYAVSKHAVVAYTEQLAWALQGHDIGVSVLCPGPVKTRIASAERNRPTELGVPASIAGARDALQAMLADGLDPAEVGAITRDGVRRQLLYIVTHYSRDRFMHRVASVLEDYAFAPGGPYGKR